MPHPKVKIADDSGNTVAVDTSGASNALKVALAAGDSIDIGDVEIKGHSSIGHGLNASISDSTAEQITASSTPCKHVDIMASVANTGFIMVGGEGVAEGAAEGIRLYAGDIYSIDIENLNLIYVLASSDGEDIMWTYFN